MKVTAILVSAAVFAVALFLAFVPTWSLPPIRSTDYGPAAGEMVVFKDSRAVPESAPQPEVLAATDIAAGGGSSGYQNVQVLTGVSKAEFDRTMVAITKWVAPQQGCAFCHQAGASYAADNPRKQIARQMLAMVRTMNANWTDHVGTQGVTCYSCHSGHNIPNDRWLLDAPLVPPEGGILGKPQAWNTSAKTIRNFFPSRPNRMFLLQGLPANHVQAREALATSGTKPAFMHDRDYAEQVYIMMMQLSNALGVNCTYCHQSRVLYDWNQSPPNRMNGYSGIKMTLMLNQNYLSKLAPWTETKLLGRMGDSAKVDCKTCHQGQERPVGGMQHVVYPALIGPLPTGPANPVAAANPDIAQLSRAPRVGVPGSDPVGMAQFHGLAQP